MGNTVARCAARIDRFPDSGERSPGAARVITGVFWVSADACADNLKGPPPEECFLLDEDFSTLRRLDSNLWRGLRG